MECSFQVGDKVVCVGDFSPVYNTEWAVAFGIEFPALGEVYTIRAIDMMPHPDGGDSPALLLKEVLNLPNPCNRAGGYVPISATFNSEVHWDFRDFRPLQTTQKDISIFTRMLNPAKQPVTA